MAGGGGDGGRELDRTPTWAVASVCAVIVIISIALEKALHRLGHWFTEKKKKAMFEALEKVKAELMILGFISLLLTFGQTYIARICIPENIADTMLPCSLEEETEGHESGGHRRLLWEEIFPSSVLNRRFLAGAAAPSCPAEKVPLVSINGVHQLHIFVFFLAVFHVINSAITMALGRAKIRKWKEWEKETQSLEYEYSNDPGRFRLAHETSFVRQHTGIWNRNKILFYISSFFRQFYRSVRKADYLTLRYGFISTHLAPGSKFDFQKYIKRSLEDDFKTVVGISLVLWASAVILLLLNVNGWMTLFWASLLPLVILLLVGTKLQAIIAQMALEIKERHVVIQGVPLVQLSDRYFWFKSPGLVLNLIHFTLFQNAFQIIYFLWILYSFGLNSCFNENMNLLIARVCLGVGVQILCSYVTLPLYALVSQMGSQMKTTIFNEQTSKALKKWHQAVKKKHGRSTTHSKSTTPMSSPNISPAHALYRFKTVGHSASSTGPLRRRYFSDQELSDTETEMMSPAPPSPPGDHEDVELGSKEHHSGTEEHQRTNTDDFSFVKLLPQSG